LIKKNKYITTKIKINKKSESKERREKTKFI